MDILKNVFFIGLVSLIVAAVYIVTMKHWAVHEKTGPVPRRSLWRGTGLKNNTILLLIFLETVIQQGIVVDIEPVMPFPKVTNPYQIVEM